MLKKLVVAVVVLAVSSGCSFMHTKGPPYAASNHPGCPAESAAPTTDFILAGTAGALGLLALLGSTVVPASSTGPSDRAGGAAGGGVLLGLGGLAAWSGVQGSRNVAACREAVAQWVERRPEIERQQCERLARVEFSRLTGTVPEAGVVQVSVRPAITPMRSNEEPFCAAKLGLRELECTVVKCEETHASKELQVAIDRLSLETTCSREMIQLVSQSNWRAGTETAFRLRACSADYVCTIAAGRAECKAALSGNAVP